MASATAQLCALLVSGTTCYNYSSVFPDPATATVSPTQCQGFFTGVPDGNTTDMSGDTINCRLNYAKMAQTLAVPYYCHFAGLTGGGVCGVPLAASCGRIVSVCNGIASLPASYAGNTSNCMADLKAAGLEFQIGSKAGGAAQSENSLECRVYHATVGNLQGGATPHCGHVDSKTTGPCASGAVANNVNHYCGLTEVTCTGGYQQYFSNGVAANHFLSCVNSVSAFPPCNQVVVGDTNQTQCARQYHINANAGSGWNSAHCAHAGPSGGGLVGDPRTSWMYVTNGTGCGPMGGNNMAWVAAQIGQAMLTWPTTLAKVVPSNPLPNLYNVTFQSTGQTNDESCRTYHATTGNVGTQALAVHCSHGSILGGGQCPADMTVPLCAMIMAACPSAYATTGACATAFGPYVPSATVTAPKLGDACGALKGHPDAGDTLACRVFFATAALSPNMGVANACMNAAVAGATGCNVSALPPAKGSASILSISGISALLAFLW